MEDSPSWRAFTGQSLEDYEGEGWLLALHEEDRVLGRDLLCATSVGREPRTAEYRLRHSSGVFRWTHARAVPLWAPDGSLRGWLGTNTDITALRDAGDLVRLAMESAPTGMVLVDHEGNIALVNAQVERLFGYPREELIGRSVDLLLPAHVAERHGEFRHLYWHKPEARLMGVGRELFGRRKDGSEVPLEVGLNPLETKQGRFVLSSIVDITERRRLEEERERWTRELTRINEILEERTRDLSASLEERTVLLQEVHHRVKNNLQVISSLINMQMRNLPEAAERVALQECQARVLAIALIHETIYQAKSYSRVPFTNYAKTLAGYVVQAGGAEAKGVTFEFRSDDVELPVDKAIPCALILNELITNALKHAFPAVSRGMIGLEVRLSGKTVRLLVSDSGIGMPEGFRLETANSLGMQLVSTLAGQLDASFSWTNVNGARFEIVFDL